MIQGIDKWTENYVPITILSSAGDVPQGQGGSQNLSWPAWKMAMAVDEHP